MAPAPLVLGLVGEFDEEGLGGRGKDFAVEGADGCLRFGVLVEPHEANSPADARGFGEYLGGDDGAERPEQVLQVGLVVRFGEIGHVEIGVLYRSGRGSRVADFDGLVLHGQAI